MKKILLPILLITLTLSTTALAAEAARTAPAMTTAMTTAPAAMTAAPAAMTAPTMEAAPAMPAAMPAPMVAAPPQTAPAMSAAPPAAPKKSADEKATNWITMLTPILGGIIVFVLAYLNKKNKLDALKSERGQLILTYVKMGVESFDKYAAGTDRKWDDAVAKLLKDVNNALIAAGQEPLTAVEQAQVKQQAGAQKSLVEDDAKTEAPTEPEAEEKTEEPTETDEGTEDK